MPGDTAPKLRAAPGYARDPVGADFSGNVWVKVRCPGCHGAKFEVVRPGTLRCTTERIVDVLRPGMSGNAGPGEIPIYGVCGHTALEDRWRETALVLEHEAADRAAKARATRGAEIRFQERAEYLKGRRVELLAELRRLGNPGLEARRVPGRYKTSRLAFAFGRSGKLYLFDVEGAWSIGTFTWWHPVQYRETYEDLATGYTPSGRVVPMRHATKGDSVDPHFARRVLGDPRDRRDYRDPYRELRVPTDEDIVPALEKALARGFDAP